MEKEMRTWLAVWFLVQSRRDWDGVSVGETQVMRMEAGREGARGRSWMLRRAGLMTPSWSAEEGHKLGKGQRKRWTFDGGVCD